MTSEEITRLRALLFGKYAHPQNIAKIVDGCADALDCIAELEQEVERLTVQFNSMNTHAAKQQNRASAAEQRADAAATEHRTHVAQYTYCCLGCGQTIDAGQPCTVWKGFVLCGDTCVENHKQWLDENNLAYPVARITELEQPCKACERVIDLIGRHSDFADYADFIRALHDAVLIRAITGSDGSTADPQPRLEDLLGQLGKNYRGLWVSYMIENDGTLYQGWSATVSIPSGDLGGQMVETSYQDTPHQALQAALMILDGTGSDGSTKGTGDE